MYRLFIVVASLIIMCHWSCQPSSYFSDVVPADIIRFDQYLRQQSTAELKAEYPSFSALYFQQLIQVEQDSGVVNKAALDQFLDDEFIEHLNQKSDSIFNDMTDIELELGLSFDLFVEAFDKRTRPAVYTYISGLAYQCVLFDDDGGDGVGIGLDMFLGSSHPYVDLSFENPAFSSYIVRSFNRDHLSKKAVESLVQHEQGESQGNRLIDHMIHNGKKLYILDQLLPYVSDTVIMEFTPEQLQWCEANEREIWSHFFREDLFYETDMRKINKLIYPSPSSPGMPTGAPGRTANYIGWKIVTKFMQRNQMSIRELLNWHDSQSLLDKSKYKPL